MSRSTVIPRRLLVIALALLGASMLLISLLITPATQANTTERSTRALNTDLCFATHDDGTTVAASIDGSAVQTATNAAESAGASVVKVAGTCASSAVIANIDFDVTLRGGYTDSDWNTSDPVNNPTTLSGNNSSHVMDIGNYGGPMINVTLENLIIRDGYRNSDEGAGLDVISSTVTISNTTITSNTVTSYGGGIFAEESHLIIRASDISTNTAHNGGGAGIYITEGSIDIQDSNLSNNNDTGTSEPSDDDEGNAVLAKGSPVHISNSTLNNNTGSGLSGTSVDGTSESSQYAAQTLTANVTGTAEILFSALQNSPVDMTDIDRIQLELDTAVANTTYEIDEIMVCNGAPPTDCLTIDAFQNADPTLFPETISRDQGRSHIDNTATEALGGIRYFRANETSDIDDGADDVLTFDTAYNDDFLLVAATSSATSDIELFYEGDLRGSLDQDWSGYDRFVIDISSLSADVTATLKLYNINYVPPIDTSFHITNSEVSGNEQNGIYVYPAAVSLDQVSLTNNGSGGEDSRDAALLTSGHWIYDVNRSPIIANASHFNNNGGSFAIIAENDPLTLTASTVMSNASSGIYAHSLYMSDTTVAYNNDNPVRVADGDGWIENSHLVNNLGGTVAQNDEGTLVISNTNITSNTSSSIGGIAQFGATGHLIVENSLIQNNQGAFSGAGLALEGLLTIRNTSVLSNTSNYGGGFTVLQFTADGAPNLVIEESTIAHNSAGFGGAIAQYGSSSAVTITNSTVSHNSATGSGGAINNGPSAPFGSSIGGDLTLTNATIYANSAVTGSQLAILDGSTTLINSIIAAASGDTVSNCGLTSSTVNSNGNNIDSDGSCALTGTDDQSGVSAGLADLADNGGDTMTNALIGGSPAIDAGSAMCLTTDQRGQARIDNCDIGAYESSKGFGFSVTSGASQSADIDTAFAADLQLTVTSANGEPIGPGGTIVFNAPTSGASITTATITTTTDINGQVSISVIANSDGGSYSVVATGNGIDGSASFNLTNIPDVSVEVTNNSDSGSGSLREAVTLVNSGEAIGFNSGVNGLFIQLLSALNIPTNILVDASSLANSITISGTVNNQGTIQATKFGAHSTIHNNPTRAVGNGVLTNVELGDGVTVNDGTLSGSISGSNTTPSVLNNVEIADNTVLNNVTLSGNTIVGTGVTLGDNVTIEAGITISNAIISGTVTNMGHLDTPTIQPGITVNNANGTITAGTNNGTINDGTVTGNLANGGTLNSVTIDSNGTIDNANGTVSGGTNQGTINGGTITGNVTNSGTLSGTTIDASGNIANTGGTVSGLSNAGTITGGTIDGDLTNSGTLSGVTITAGSTITNSGGTVTGGTNAGTINAGTVDGTLTNEGTIINATIALTGAVDNSNGQFIGGTNSGVVTGGTISGTISNSGTFSGTTVAAASTVTGGTFAGATTNNGTLTDVTFGATATISGTVSGTISGTADSPISLTGVTVADGSTLAHVTIVSNTTLGNTTTLDNGVVIDSGVTVTDVTVTGDITNNGTLSGSTINSGATVDNSNGTVEGTTNAGTISGGTVQGVIDNSGGQVENATIAAGATISNTGGTVSGGTNNGTIDAGTISGTMTNNGTIDGSTVNASSTVNNSNGTVSAITNNGTVTGGAVEGNVTNNGILENTTIAVSAVVDNSNGFVDGGTNNGTINGGATTPSLINNGTMNNVTVGSFVITGSTVSESDSTATITITFGAAASEPMTVTLNTEDDTAVSTSGGDFTSITNSEIVFTPGTISQTVQIAINNDGTVEETEQLTVTLSNPQGLGANITVDSAVVTIEDDDSATLSIADATVNEGDGVTIITVTQSAVSSSDTAVSVNVGGILFRNGLGQATAGVDYISFFDTAVIQAGNTAITVTVPITDDILVEDDEQFDITISKQSGDSQITVGDASGTVTITDNDSATVSIADASVAEGETVTLTITLSAARDAATTMMVNTSDGSATGSADNRSTADYEHLSTMATIPQGALTTTVTIVTYDDAAVEGQETFSVTLSALTRANISFGQDTAVVVLTENDTDDESTSVTAAPAVETSLTFTPTNETTPTITTVEIPANAVSETVTFVYTDIQTDTEDSGFSFVGTRFDITAYIDGESQDGYTFASPVTITLQYSDTILAGLDEDTLTLQYWTGTDWVDAAATCYGDDPSLVPENAYTIDPTANTLTVQICHLTEFALFAETAGQNIYLPIIFRN